MEDRISVYKEFSKCIEYPIVLFDAVDGHVIDINYEASTILGTDIKHIEMTPDKFMQSEDFWGKLKRRKALIWHRIVLTVDGTRYLLSGLVNEFEIDEKLVYMVLFESRGDANIGSITLEKIVNHAGIVAIYMYRPKDRWKVRYVSKNINTYGYTSEQLYEGMIDPLEMVYYKDRSNFENLLYNNPKNGIDDYSVEFRMVTESKRYVYMNATIHVVRDAYGKAEGVEALLFNVNEARQSENENSYLSEAMHKIKTVVLVKTYDGEERRVKYLSSNANSILGMNIDAVYKGNKLTEDYVHPDDREDMLDTLYNAITHNVKDCELSYRIVGDDGVCRYVNSQILIKRISESEAYIEFIITDISEHKQAEEELLKVQKKLEKKVDYVMQADKQELEDDAIDTKAIFVKEKLEETYGSFAKVSGLYSAILDKEGNLITTPIGPDLYMGRFYDMFERPCFREQFMEINKSVMEQGSPQLKDIRLSDHAVHVSVAPLISGEKYIGSWILAGYDGEDLKKLNENMPQQWGMARRTASYIGDAARLREIARRNSINMLKLETKMKKYKVFTDILESIGFDDNITIDSICEKVGRYLSIDRIVIFKMRDNDGKYRNIHVWDTSGDSNARNDYDVSSMEYEFMKNYLESNEEIVVSSDDYSKDNKIILLSSKIKAVIILPIVIDGKHYGNIAFVESRQKRHWKDSEIKFAKKIRNIVTSILKRKLQSGNVKQINSALLKAYDYVNEPVFIKDAYSDEVLYSNKATDTLLGYNFVGTDSRKLLKSPSQVLSGTDLMRKRKVANTEEIKWQSYLSTVDRIMDITELEIEWKDGRMAKLLILSEVNQKEDN